MAGNPISRFFFNQRQEKATAAKSPKPDPVAVATAPAGEAFGQVDDPDKFDREAWRHGDYARP